MEKCENCGHDQIDHDYAKGDLWIGSCQIRIGSWTCTCEGYIEPEDVELVEEAENNP